MSVFVANLAKRGPHDALNLHTILGAPCPHCQPLIAEAIRATPPEIALLPEHLDWHEKMWRYEHELEECIVEMADRITALLLDLEARDALIAQLKAKPAVPRTANVVSATEEHLRRGLASSASK